jgi:hypothetical protein
MDVGMIHEVLPPGVENADTPDLCPEMFRVICELGKGLGDRTEKKIVKDLAVHGDQGIKFRGEGEDHMEILNGQEILAAGLDPFFFPQGLAFGAMAIPAGVIRYFHMTAMVALIPMATKGSGSAYLDGAHNSQLIAGQPMGFSISRAVLTENIRNLKATRCLHPLSGLRSWFGCPIERAEDLGQVEPTDMQIDGSRGGRSVAQKHLDMMEARSRFNQVGGEAVP